MENSTLMMNITGPFSYRGKNSITDYAENLFQQATLENYGQAEMPEWDDSEKGIF